MLLYAIMGPLVNLYYGSIDFGITKGSAQTAVISSANLSNIDGLKITTDNKVIYTFANEFDKNKEFLTNIGAYGDKLINITPDQVVGGKIAFSFGDVNATTKTVAVKANYTLAQFGFESLFGSKFNAVLAQNVLNGILIGSLVAYVYNRAWNVELPKVLGFFSGRRLIPALAIITTIVFSILWALIFPWIGYVIYIISSSMSKATSTIGADGKPVPSSLALRATIMGGYGFFNRLLIPFGLHHIPNNLFWFQLGEFHTEAGDAVHGDIFIFLQGAAKGNPGGLFQAGFFPMMMFGLPALVGAFWYTSENTEQRKRVFALFGSAAVISFLTGITEPIEFAFVYVSPLLYLVHAILTGIFAFITGLFGIQIGFGFSAGAMDYLLSINKSLAIIRESGFTGAAKVFANPGWIIPIGLVCGLTYFFVGTLMIKKLDLSTPGRKDGVILAEKEDDGVLTPLNEETGSGLSQKAKQIVLAYGGWDNIVEYNNCSTRLRYIVKDGTKVDDQALKKAGVFGVVRMSDTTIHSIVGVEAEGLNTQIVEHKGETLE
ncbi:PTS glucose transporter subunit IIABC [Mycoplasma sp. NEAQ87857]|nr:PTS glucose transporter subunit IIABC [Mycoplasma sp. NEAQ87857]